MKHLRKKVPRTSRRILWYLVFSGFAINYMIRINLNIALVAMIRTKAANVSISNECPSSQNLNSSKGTKNLINIKNINNNKFVENNTFNWDEKVQANILGSFFWLHFVTQLPGGILAGKYGTKLVFGLGNFLAVICNFFIPIIANKFGADYLILLRIIQGIVSGVCWPSMHNLTAKWIPPNERSKFVTAYLGSSLGAALTYPICGYIIEKCGWQFVFYVCGLLGTLWYISWLLLAYDSPAHHPRISSGEKEYIISSLGRTVAHTKTAKITVPWCDILSDSSVWINIITQAGSVWGLFTLLTHTPTYVKIIHGWNITATGFLSGLPHLLRILWALIFSQIGDYLLRSKKLSRTNVRKLATIICNVVQGLFIILLAYSGCNALLAMIFLSLAVALNGSVSTGILANIVDISPNYASVILGLLNTAVAVVGFTTPVIVGHFTFQNQTVKQWQKVFWISGGISSLSGLIFLIFGKSELRPWNTPKKKIENENFEAEEMICKSKKNYKNLIIDPQIGSIL